MKDTWSLDILYKGYDDTFQKDIKAFEKSVKQCNELAASLSHDNEKETLVNILKTMEEMALLHMRLGEYTALRQSTNTTDSQTAAYDSQITRIASSSSKAIAAFHRYISETDNLDTLIEQDEFLKDYHYLLHTIKEDGKYLLSNDVEDVLSKMNISGGNAWEMMHSYLTSTLEVEYKGETTTLSAIRNLAYDDSQEVRKEAYEAELKAYDKIKDAISFSLNNIKQQVLCECDLRGYESPLAMTLHQSRMKKETLDAMLSAMKDYMPIFHKYLRRKAEVMGYKNGLPWYELFAPMGKTNTKFTIETAKDYLISHFSPFASDMADMMKQAFEEEWIDFYPKKGKVGGAFCANLPFVKQSRVLTNFDGNIGDVVTLAHELGHAYHGMMIEDHRILNTDYSMPVAETASTFNENIIMNAVIEEANDEEKLVLLENQLQDLTQIMCDIYSRFLFESEVFERRKNEFLFSKDLEEIMLNAQKTAYGDGLDPNYLHPYMWVNKGHYYSSQLSFYNFPYAFGGLFARGLIVKYKEMKENFVPKYREMLKATTVSDVEDVAKILDIDLTSKDFWISSLETAKKDIETFLSLTESK